MVYRRWQAFSCRQRHWPSTAALCVTWGHLSRSLRVAATTVRIGHFKRRKGCRVLIYVSPLCQLCIPPPLSAVTDAALSPTHICLLDADTGCPCIQALPDGSATSASTSRLARCVGGHMRQSNYLIFFTDCLRLPRFLVYTFHSYQVSRFARLRILFSLTPVSQNHTSSP